MDKKSLKDIKKIIKISPVPDQRHSYISYHVMNFFKSKGIHNEMLVTLQQKIPVIYPWDSSYDVLRQNLNKRHNVFPLFIVMVQRNEDIVTSMKFAKHFNIPFRVRGRGHCSESLSLCNGIVIDLSLKQKIIVNQKQKKILIEAGVSHHDLALELSKYKLGLPLSSCPDASVVGTTLCGGTGLLSHDWGTLADNLVELEIITSDGQVVRCNDNDNDDLFKACRGYGPGNFGVVTEMIFKAQSVGKILLFELTFTGQNYKPVISLWQESRLVSKLKLKRDEQIVSGQYLGSDQDLKQLLESYVDLSPKIKIWSASFLEAFKYESSVISPYFKVKTDFSLEPLSEDALDVLETYLLESDSSDEIDFSVVDKTPLIEYWSQWNDSHMESRRLDWIRTLYHDMRPYVSGYSYGNYADMDIENYSEVYYGTELDALITVKNKYDPVNLFVHPRSIPTSMYKDE